MRHLRIRTGNARGGSRMAPAPPPPPAPPVFSYDTADEHFTVAYNGPQPDHWEFFYYWSDTPFDPSQVQFIDNGTDGPDAGTVFDRDDVIGNPIPGYFAAYTIGRDADEHPVTPQSNTATGQG